MRPLDVFAPIIIVFVLVIAVHFIRGEFSKSLPAKGEKYLFSFDINNPDPFKHHIDTITVIEVKSGYVLWEYKNGIRQSGSDKIFNELTRKIN